MPRDEFPLVISDASESTDRGSTQLLHTSSVTGEQTTDDVATGTTNAAAEVKTCGVTARRRTCLGVMRMLGHNDAGIKPA